MIMNTKNYYNLIYFLFMEPLTMHRGTLVGKRWTRVIDVLKSEI